MHNGSRYDSLELLFSKKIFPVLVLSGKLSISTLNTGFFFIQLLDHLLELFDLLTSFFAASFGAFAILKAFSSLFVLIGVILVVKLTPLIIDDFLGVLLLFLRVNHGTSNGLIVAHLLFIRRQDVFLFCSLVYRSWLLEFKLLLGNFILMPDGQMVQN